jgi:hypothetical protein
MHGYASGVPAATACRPQHAELASSGAALADLATAQKAL